MPARALAQVATVQSADTILAPHGSFDKEPIVIDLQAL
jgi:hypothetical protein